MHYSGIIESIRTWWPGVCNLLNCNLVAPCSEQTINIYWHLHVILPHYVHVMSIWCTFIYIYTQWYNMDIYIYIYTYTYIYIHIVHTYYIPVICLIYPSLSPYDFETQRWARPCQGFARRLTLGGMQRKARKPGWRKHQDFSYHMGSLW